jgi:hypothetical protein
MQRRDLEQTAPPGATPMDAEQDRDGPEAAVFHADAALGDHNGILTDLFERLGLRGLGCHGFINAVLFE